MIIHALKKRKAEQKLRLSFATILSSFVELLRIRHILLFYTIYYCYCDNILYFCSAKHRLGYSDYQRAVDAQQL